MTASKERVSDPRRDADPDYGLRDKIQEYHRHGGPQGSDHARGLEGEISATSAEHDHQLKQARPNASVTRGE